MMKNTTEVALESLLVSSLNVSAVYLAAFTYQLSWSGVLTVMIIASALTAFATHLIILTGAPVKARTEQVVSEGLSVILVALLSSLAVFIILCYRFNVPMALGISLLSGILSSLLRHLMA